jgi:hypothetical protein
VIERVHVDPYLRLEVEPTAGIARLARTRTPFPGAEARGAALVVAQAAPWPRPRPALRLLVDLRAAPGDVAAFAGVPDLVAGFARVAVLLPGGVDAGAFSVPTFTDEGAAMRHLLG